MYKLLNYEITVLREKRIVMATKIAIANHKGGIGKTTTAINLAANLIERGYKVLLIDTDPQRNSTKVYGAEIDGVGTLADIMYADEKASECIQTTDIGDIIASDPTLKEAETRIPVDTDRFYHLSDSMDGVENNYDYIVFDTPPGTGVLLGNVLSYADMVLIPVTRDYLGIQGLTDFYDTVNDYRKRINKGLKIAGILRVKYKGRQSLTRDIEENILPKFAEDMDTKLFNTTIRESVKCQEAQTLKQSLYKYARYCTTAVDYDEFVDELMEDIK